MNNQHFLRKICLVLSLGFIATFLSGCKLLKSILGDDCSTCSHHHAAAHVTNAGNILDDDGVFSSKNFQGEEVLVSFSDGSALTREFLMKKIKAAFEEMGFPFTPSSITQEQLKMMTEQMMQSKLMYLANKDAINQNSKALERIAIKQAEVAVMEVVQSFYKDLNKNVTTDENQVYAKYQSEKNRYVKTAGGTLSVGAEFDNAADAESFRAKVVLDATMTPEAFRKILEEFNASITEQGRKEGQFRDFGPISNTNFRGVNEKIIYAAEQAADSKLPSLNVIEINAQSHWTTLFYDYRETEFFAFSEVRDRIAQEVQAQLTQQAFLSTFEELKQRFITTKNEEFFAGGAPASMPAGMEQYAMDDDQDVGAEEEA